MRHPGKGVGHIEDRTDDLPFPHEWIYKVQVPSNWQQAVVHSVRVFEVDLTVLHILARKQKQLSISVELNSFRRQINSIGSL
jgi:hypothetical protein